MKLIFREGIVVPTFPGGREGGSIGTRALSAFVSPVRPIVESRDLN